MPWQALLRFQLPPAWTSPCHRWCGSTNGGAEAWFRGASPVLASFFATNKLALASRVTLEKIHAEILLQTCIKRCRTSKKLNPFLVTRKKVRSRFTWFQLHLATENEITPDWLRCLRVEGPAGAPTQCPVMVTHLMSNSLFFTSWTRNINNLTNI